MQELLNMVSTQGYLCPDFLPPSADTNGKNPLQLLAQTCNNIGLPDPPIKNNKTVAAHSNEKVSSKSENSKSKSSSTANSDAAANHDEKETTTTTKNSYKNTSANGDHHDNTEKSTNKDDSSKSKHDSSRPNSSTDVKLNGAAAHRTSSMSNSSSIPTTSTSIGQVLPPTLTPAGIAPKCTSCIPPYPASAAMFPNLFGATTAGLFGLGGNSAVNPLGNHSAAAAAALYAGLNPFLPTMCRDPFCKSCPGAAAAAAAAAAMRCPLGCVQCTPGAHNMTAVDSLWWLSSYPFLAAAAQPSAAAAAAAMANQTSPLSSLYAAHSFAAANAINNGSTTATNGANATAAAGGHICSWVSSSDGPCNKRFSSSEELLQHLRSAHTCSEALHNSAVNNNISSCAATVNNPLATLSSLSTLPGMHMPVVSTTGAGGRFSPRTYLNSLAGISSLNRFHPYSKPPATTGTVTPAALSFPALNPASAAAAAAAAYPLASLYGQRLPGSLPHH